MIFFFVSLTTYLCYLILKYKKGLEALEQANFNIKKYNKWILAKENFLTLELLSIIIIIIAFNTDAKIAGISMVIFYTLLYLYELKTNNSQIKIKGRIIPIIILTIIIHIIIFSAFYLDYLELQKELLIFDNSQYYYLITIIIGYFANYIILGLAFITNISISLKNKIKRKK